MVVLHDDVTFCGVLIDVTPHTVVGVVILSSCDDHDTTLTCVQDHETGFAHHHESSHVVPVAYARLAPIKESVADRSLDGLEGCGSFALHAFPRLKWMYCFRGIIIHFIEMSMMRRQCFWVTIDS